MKSVGLSTYSCGVVSVKIMQEKAIRLFSYLRDLARLNAKLTRDIFEYDGVVWFDDVPEYKGCFSILSSRELERVQDGIWLEVRKAVEPRRPPIPPSCSRWVEENLEDDLLSEPSMCSEIPLPALPDEQAGVLSHAVERLCDHPELSEEWQAYIQDSWLPWSHTYRAWKAADNLYFRLFSLHQELKKLGEKYELVLGLGLLTWETPNNQIIRRHIVVGDACLTFDADRAKFELQGAPVGIKLRFETEMIESSSLPSMDQQTIIDSQLSSIQESPWSKDEIDKILRSWVNSISPDGEYSGALAPPEKCAKAPVVTFAPAIILRQRTQQSQTKCFNSIVEQIRQSGNVPHGVQQLCEISETPSDTASGEMPSRCDPTVDSTLYLPLPINDEQIQIVHQIENRQGILVQGPPGTGKSHTIANLICHLLAQGKRVLVTSQTPRALRVLKDKIPPELSALCVTLLGNDHASRQELEASVHGINQQYSDWNSRRNQNTIAFLDAHLFETRKEIADKKRLLREQREIDTNSHEVADGAYRGTAQEIACRIKSEESRFDWLADDIVEGKPCPLSNHEILELIALYRALSDNYCAELRKDLVARDCIPDVARFVSLVDDERTAKQDFELHSSRNNSVRFLTLSQQPDDCIKSLHAAISELLASLSSIQDKSTWMQAAVLDVLSGRARPWKELHSFMGDHLKGLQHEVGIIQNIEVRLPAMDHRQLSSDAKDLFSHLQMGGKLGWLFLAPPVVKKSRYIRKQVYIDGKPCTSLEKLKLLVTYLHVLYETESLWTALKGKANKEEGSLLLQVGCLQERFEALQQLIKLDGCLAAARDRLVTIEGVPEPQWHQVEEVEEIIRDIQATESERNLKRVRSAIEDTIRKVRIAQASPRAHSLNQEILTALENRDAKAVARCLENFDLIENDRVALLSRIRLQRKLMEAAPEFARSLQNTFDDSVWDQRATSFEEAWVWKQTDKWLKRFSYEHDEATLESDLTRLVDDENKTISKLAAAKAWSHCLGRLTAVQRSNLTAWATAIGRMPKTLTAKTRPKWVRQAQECMDNCKGAIPAWIMPLYRVFETIAPEPECFDVVIIDEASQTGPGGLIVTYLAKQCIVVGDAQQISPDSVGQPEAENDHLVKRYMDGMPFKDFYHPETSLFSFAEILFSGKIVLREHFRCVPEIIQFSNQLCYASTPLRPLRQYLPKRLEPLVVHHVQNGFREGSASYALNRPEADELIETIARMCSLDEYTGKTMGVVSLQGEAQAKYIEDKLTKRLSPIDLEKRRIVCGDAYAFQGDERDVIFLSMVAAPNERIGPLVTPPYKRRFNVAASRAKDQLVLFHTATLNDLNPECMRYKLLEYCQNFRQSPLSVDGIDLSRLREMAHSSDRRRGTQPAPFESWFEVDVFINIADRGFRIVPQYRVAEYRIDLVVEGAKSRLAVECDGDEWHGIEEYERDNVRERVLVRCGWRFFRVRGHEYYRDPAVSLTSLWKTLKDSGIEPSAYWAQDGQDKTEILPSAHATTSVVPFAQNATEYHKAEIAAVPKQSQQPIVPFFHRDNSVKSDQGDKSEEKDAITPTGESQICSQVNLKYDHSTNITEKTGLLERKPEFYDKMAKWAKDNKSLSKEDLLFIFSVRNYIRNKWTMTKEQQIRANQIVEKAEKLGFKESDIKLY